MVYAEHCKSDGFVIEINFVVTIKSTKIHENRREKLGLPIPSKTAKRNTNIKRLCEKLP